jgi:hypothetical protein
MLHMHTLAPSACSGEETTRRAERKTSYLSTELDNFLDRVVRIFDWSGWSGLRGIGHLDLAVHV